MQELIAHVPADHTAWLLIEPYRAADLAKRLALAGSLVRMQTKWTASRGDVEILALRRS
jgi:hypothetical protein